MPVETATGAVLDIERFEWAAPDRIEITGRWSGLRGRRFIRPTLMLQGEGEPKRLLATLDHKPWSAQDGEDWIAAFKWDGEPMQFESADLNVGSGIDVELPAPGLKPGRPRRSPKRAVSRDATRDEAVETPRAARIVSDPPTKETSRPDRPAAKAAAKKSTSPKPAASAAFAASVEPEPTVALEPVPPAEDEGLRIALDTARSELAAVRADLDRLRGERDQMRRERDTANEKVRSLRAELEQERQARETAVGDARANERQKATTMLAEGAELRAAVERQREIAYLERDDAKKQRDGAVASRDNAVAERDEAVGARKLAERERKDAQVLRDRAVKAQQRAEADRAKALADRDDADRARDEAIRKRDEILSVHERGLPVHPPKPRFLPEDEERQSGFEVWAPRVVAVGILLLFAFIVLRLFAGA